MPETISADRDAQGRFARGNPGGPGNPFARQVAALRTALLARVTAADIGEVIDEVQRQAKTGNMTAAKLLLSYTVGKPAPTVEPDRLDVEEWSLFKQESAAIAELPAVGQATSATVPLKLVRSTRPYLDLHIGRGIAELLRAPSPNGKARRKARRAKKAAKPDATGPTDTKRHAGGARQ